MKNNNNIFMSVVVPCYNEEAMILPFYKRTAPILSNIDERFEIIFINDGSKDKTVINILSLRSSDNRVKLVDLSRNFGKEIAVSAGLDHAAGDVVVIIDADLQDPPELIPKMVEKWREGFDDVYATRTIRDGETFFKKFTANAFYRIIGVLTRIDIPKNTGDFRLLSRRTVDVLKTLREQHRFMKGLFSWVGFKQTSIPYRREPRFAGRSKWNYWKLWNFAIEGITSFSFIPLQLAGYIGTVIAIFAFSYAGFITVKTLILGIDLPGYASMMVVILFSCGVQLIVLGVIGEYIGRISDEVKQRPLYFAQNIVGFSRYVSMISKPTKIYSNANNKSFIKNKAFTHQFQVFDNHKNITSVTESHTRILKFTPENSSLRRSKRH